jgi:hypothetical protein
MEKKITASDWNAHMAKQARELVRSGQMPSFDQLADALASSPAAQELFKIKLRSLIPEAKSHNCVGSSSRSARAPMINRPKLLTASGV